MLIDLLVWLGVVFAAYIAWSLYNGTDALSDDPDSPSGRREPPRREDSTRRT